jgi:hypothetical protein
LGLILLKAFRTYDTLTELSNAKRAFEENTYLASKERIRLIPGDATKTMPKFVQENPWFICSMLYLDFDIYEPTKVALETFVPRMPKGAVLAFDEIHNPNWAGETQALVDTLGLNRLQLKNFEFEPHVTYAILD